MTDGQSRWRNRPADRRSFFAKQAERGMTMLLVTHDPSLAARCTEQVRMRSARSRALSLLPAKRCRHERGRAVPPVAEAGLARDARRLERLLHLLACIALGTGANCCRQFGGGLRHRGDGRAGSDHSGGDIRFQINNRDVTPEEEAYFKSFGQVSRSDTIRSMARKADGSDQTLSEVKAVDGSYRSTARCSSSRKPARRRRWLRRMASSAPLQRRSA